MRLFTMVAAVVFLFGTAAQAKPLEAVASFSILGDIVREIGGDDVHVVTLVGPDADTHAYQPAADDGRKIAQADVVFINGLGFEGWAEKLTQTAGYKGTVVTVAQGITLQTLDGGSDPHVWQDAGNVRVMAATIAGALAKAQPAHAAAFATRAKAYTKQLDTLDAWIRAQWARVPSGQRKVVTSHDAFGYYARAYGVTMLAAEGLSTDSEPSAAAIARLSDQIRDTHVRRVFLENMSSPRLIRQIAQDTGAQVGGTLYADALSGPAGPASTYLQMMRYNTQTLLDGLVASGSGNAP